MTPILRAVVLAGAALVLSATATAAQQTRARANVCRADVQKLCANVQPGGGRIVQCLASHQDQLSDGCKAALEAARERRRGKAGNSGTPPAGTAQ